MGHGFGCGDGSCIDWHQRRVVRVFSAINSLRGVRSSLVAAVSLLAWARLGCSSSGFCFYCRSFLIKKMITKTIAKS